MVNYTLLIAWLGALVSVGGIISTYIVGVMRYEISSSYITFLSRLISYSFEGQIYLCCSLFILCCSCFCTYRFHKYCSVRLYKVSKTTTAELVILWSGSIVAVVSEAIRIAMCILDFGRGRKTHLSVMACWMITSLARYTLNNYLYSIINKNRFRKSIYYFDIALAVVSTLYLIGCFTLLTILPVLPFSILSIVGYLAIVSYDFRLVYQTSLISTTGQPQTYQPRGQKREKKKAAPKAAPKPQSSEDTRDALSFLDIRVGKIVKVWEHPAADTLYREEIDIGDGKIKQVVTGVRNFVPIEKMKDRLVVVFCNIKPSKIRGEQSEAMVFAASDSDSKHVELLDPPADTPVGTRVLCGDFVKGEATGVDSKGKYWKAVSADGNLSINSKGQACYKGVPLSLPQGNITVPTLRNCEFH